MHRTALHHTAPGKMLYCTDENLSPYVVFDVGWIRSVGKIVAYMYVGYVEFKMVGRVWSAGEIYYDVDEYGVAVWVTETNVGTCCNNRIFG